MVLCMGYCEGDSIAFNVFQFTHAVEQGNHICIRTFQTVHIVNKCLCVLQFTLCGEGRREVFSLQFLCNLFHFFLCLYCIIRGCFLQSSLVTVNKGLLPVLIFHVCGYIVGLAILIPCSTFPNVVKFVPKCRNSSGSAPHMKRRGCDPHFPLWHRENFAIHFLTDFRSV